MKPDEYVILAIRTENLDLAAIKHRYSFIIRLDHASKGMVTEVGEFTDILKKWIIYGKEIDFNNIIEELGDLMWYVALACNALNISLEEVMKKNIRKLQARYPEKFSEEKAINRNLEREQEELRVSRRMGELFFDE